MNSRKRGIAAAAIGVLLLATGTISASAGSPSRIARPTSLIQTAKSGVINLAEFLGFEEDEAPAASGTIDDGAEYLAEASITVDEAIAAAQAVESGAVGEIDLEQYHGRLVFNVDIGDHDVKVDATTGEVVGSAVD